MVNRAREYLHLEYTQEDVGLLSCAGSVERLPAEKLLAWEAHGTASLARKM